MFGGFEFLHQGLPIQHLEVVLAEHIETQPCYRQDCNYRGHEHQAHACCQRKVLHIHSGASIMYPMPRAV